MGRPPEAPISLWSKGVMAGVGIATLVAVPLIISSARTKVELVPAVTRPEKPLEPAAPRFDLGKVQAAKQALASEKWVRDFVFDPDPLGVEWQIGMFSEDQREWGYGDVACMILNEHGLVDDETEVRIVDLSKLALFPGDFRSASLGQVHCATAEHAYP